MSNNHREHQSLEICCHCGRSVARGSGWFANRVPDFNNIVTRMDMNRPYPEGGFVCAECDAKTSNDEPEDDDFYDE